MTIASENDPTWLPVDNVDVDATDAVVVVHIEEFRSIPSRRDVEWVMRSNSNCADRRCASETVGFTDEGSCNTNEEVVK